MMKVSDVQKAALKKLAALGGEGVIDKYGKVIAGGERMHYMPETWLRLVANGLIEGDGFRLRISKRGWVYHQELTGEPA